MTAPISNIEDKSRARLKVLKTWKMYIGGAFVRSESGGYLVAEDGENTCRGSRKDIRDAASAALAAAPRWRERSAMNRGQILYRLAEVLEARRFELEQRLVASGAALTQAKRELDAAIDCAVIYAGWSDKYQSLISSSNPVLGPYFGFSIAEPVGVIGVLAPSSPGLLGLVGCIAPIIVSGNTCVVVAGEADPRSAISFAECLATSDIPPGVVNILTGRQAELGEPLVRHQAVRGLDLWNVDATELARYQQFSADTVKRVAARRWAGEEWYAEGARGLGMIEAFLEIKTVWHPTGI